MSKTRLTMGRTRLTVGRTRLTMGRIRLTVGRTRLNSLLVMVLPMQRLKGELRVGMGPWSGV